jgi:hypothetical protein
LTRCESPTSTHFSESTVQGCPVHYTAEHWRITVSHHSTQAPSDISVFRLPRISFHCPKLRWSTPAIFDRYQSRRPTGTIAPPLCTALILEPRLSVASLGTNIWSYDDECSLGEPKIAQAYKAERRKSTSFNVWGATMEFFDGRTVIQRRVPGTTRTTFLQIAKTVTNKISSLYPSRASTKLISSKLSKLM